MTAPVLRALRPEEAAILAPLHARAFAPPEAWGAVALRTMLEMPGAFGLAALDAAPAGANPADPTRSNAALADAALPGSAPPGSAPPEGTPTKAAPTEVALAGFVLARVAAGEAELLTVAVDPTRLRRGFGAALLAGAATAAVLRGAATLFLEVSDRNAPARALYDAAGFREVGRRRRYYADGTDALVLRLDLDPASGG